MAKTRRFLVQEYVDGAWFTVRSFPTRREATDWLKSFGTKGMRIRETFV